MRVSGSPTLLSLLSERARTSGRVVTYKLVVKRNIKNKHNYTIHLQLYIFINRRSLRNKDETCIFHFNLPIVLHQIHIMQVYKKRKTTTITKSVSFPSQRSPWIFGANSDVAGPEQVTERKSSECPKYPHPVCNGRPEIAPSKLPSSNGRLNPAKLPSFTFPMLIFKTPYCHKYNIDKSVKLVLYIIRRDTSMKTDGREFYRNEIR